jgi:serine/threonine protein kinase
VGEAVDSKSPASEETVSPDEVQFSVLAPCENPANELEAEKSIPAEAAKGSFAHEKAEVCEYEFSKRCRIIREIGTGRYGTVRLVRLLFGDEWKEIAVKYYEYGNGAEEFGNQMETIVKSFDVVDHPCLARVLCYQKPLLDVGPIIGTEYYGNGSLDSLLQDVRGGKRTDIWTPTNRVITVCSIVYGLMSLHSKNLFHGNLKPADILFDNDNGLRLTDYLSAPFEYSQLASTTMVGSPMYVAPETYSLEFDNFDLKDDKIAETMKKVDVYTFGLIAFEILTGNKVFSPRLSAADLRRKTTSSERPKIPPYIKPDFAKVIDRSWNPDASKRPSIGEIADTLGRMNYVIVDDVDTVLMVNRIRSWESHQ